MPFAYIRLIEDFLDGTLPVASFEERYLEMFKNEPRHLDEWLYEALNKLFSDVDCYSPDCLPGHETTFEISEQQLRKEAAAVLQVLRGSRNRHLP